MYNYILPVTYSFLKLGVGMQEYNNLSNNRNAIISTALDRGLNEIVCIIAFRIAESR